LRLFCQWRRIVELLEAEIAGVSIAMPALSATRAELKAYEDKLDAIVCAWVGICVREERARFFGNDGSAIWIPMPQRCVE